MVLAEPSAHSNTTSTSTPAQRLLRGEKQTRHAKQTWYLIGSIIAFLALIRLLRVVLKRISLSRAKPTQSSEKGDVEKAALPSTSGNVSLRHLPYAIGAGFRIVAFRYTWSLGSWLAASITESIFICGYIVAMFLFLFIDSEYYVSSRRTNSLVAFWWQDRAAHLASVQLPLIVALAGKNNIISFLTGISHEKLNVLHRASARTCLLLLWLHAIQRTVSGLPAKFDLSHNWMRSGVLGLTAFSLATFMSFRPFRNMAYEFFLISHIVLVAIFLTSGYFHASDPGHGSYIWPALVIWAFDRVLRLVRVTWNNRGCLPEHSTARVELLAEDTIRITFRRRITWTPGQHAYITLPSISNLPTEAHPFTIANIPEPDASNDTDVVFLVRGRGGFTGRLRNYVAQNGPSTVRALIDGPYGIPPDLREYSTVVLIAGGSGVSYTLPLLLHLVRENVQKRKSLVRRIVFVWAVREAAHLQWVSKVLTDAIASSTTDLVVEPRVYITGSEYPIPEVPELEKNKSSMEFDDKEEADKREVVERELPTYTSLKLVHGRPSIKKLLQEEITEAQGPVTVDAAGPGSMTQAVRKALQSEFVGPSSVLRGTAPVTLHIETFGMVKQ